MTEARTMSDVDASNSMRGIQRRIATAISEISGPAVSVVASLLVIGIRNNHHGAGAAWGGIAAIFCAGVPMAYIVNGVRAGKWSDHHVGEREHRAIPLTIGVASVSVAIAVLVLVHAPRELIALVVAMLAGLITVLAITHYWKVSIHTAVAAGFLGILVIVYGPWALMGLPVLAGVAWSRTVLDAHTWAQVVVGAAVGFAAAVTVFPVLR
jgi:membrane-associated phospholipid phosphatase